MLALDANILIRAILGNRVRKLVEQYARTVRLLVANSAAQEARRHLPGILLHRGTDADLELTALDRLLGLLEVLDHDVYAEQENEARRRLGRRDIDDWPTAAVALTFDCGIWTEDQDFFGAGIPTWTTDRVEIFLRSHSPKE